jgi:Na+-transporting NADH:ubiquinone oxidoreductase subunit NqrC
MWHDAKKFIKVIKSLKGGEMKKSFICMVVLLASVLVSGVSYAVDNTNDEADLAREVIQAERRLAICRVMDLTPTEKAGFWPLYDEYAAKMDETADRMVALIREYSANYQNVSDEKALEMLNELLSIDMERMKIKSEYVKKFQAVLPGVKVARFFQAENKLDAQRDMNLAAQIPLVGGTKPQQETQAQF